jgi:pimeloyl-ACP methyl ester carboxylesterase
MVDGGMRRRVGWLVVFAALCAAGCGGDDGESHARAATPQPKPARGDICTGQDTSGAKPVSLRTSDGAKLSGAVLGDGPAGAVLIHEYPAAAFAARPGQGPKCGWWPYAAYLADHGVRALLFDLRCFGDSPCPQSGRGNATADVAAAMDELRREGSERVALVGASMGGSVAVVAAAELHPAALVDLSGERDTTGLTPGIPADAFGAAPGVTAPALFAVARGDRWVSPEDMRAVAGRARSKSKRVFVFPATAGHGYDLLLGTETEWSPLASRVAAFIRRNAG